MAAHQIGGAHGDDQNAWSFGPAAVGRALDHGTQGPIAADRYDGGRSGERLIAHIVRPLEDELYVPPFLTETCLQPFGQHPSLSPSGDGIGEDDYTLRSSTVLRAFVCFVVNSQG